MNFSPQSFVVEFAIRELFKFVQRPQIFGIDAFTGFFQSKDRGRFKCGKDFLDAIKVVKFFQFLELKPRYDRYQHYFFHHSRTLTDTFFHSHNLRN